MLVGTAVGLTVGNELGGNVDVAVGTLVGIEIGVKVRTAVGLFETRSKSRIISWY